MMTLSSSSWKLRRYRRNDPEGGLDNTTESNAGIIGLVFSFDRYAISC